MQEIKAHICKIQSLLGEMKLFVGSPKAMNWRTDPRVFTVNCR